MANLLCKEILASIDKHLSASRNNSSVLDIYRTAETVQLENPTANVALEDIIEHIILYSGSNFATEFSPWASPKVPAKMNGSHHS
jgi:hypothetical protein